MLDAALSRSLRSPRLVQRPGSPMATRRTGCRARKTGSRRHGFPAVPGRDNRPGGRRPRGITGDATAAHAPRQRSPVSARRERGGQHRARRGHGGGTGTIGGDEQVKFPALPRDRHPSSGHPLPDMPHHHRLPAREGQRCPDRALPPGPPRNTRPPLLPVASHTQIAHRPQRLLPGTGQPARQDHATDPSGHRPWPTHGEGTRDIRPGAARRLAAAINWGVIIRSIWCTRSPPGRAGNIRICLLTELRGVAAAQKAGWPRSGPRC